jgi:hypothetical protein
MLLDHVRDLQQDPAALIGGDGRPGRVFEGSPGRRHRELDVFRPGRGDRREHLAGRGIDGFKGFS